MNFTHFTCGFVPFSMQQKSCHDINYAMKNKERANHRLPSHLSLYVTTWIIIYFKQQRSNWWYQSKIITVYTSGKNGLCSVLILVVNGKAGHPQQLKIRSNWISTATGHPQQLDILSNWLSVATRHPQQLDIHNDWTSVATGHPWQLDIHSNQTSIAAGHPQ